MASRPLSFQPLQFAEVTSLRRLSAPTALGVVVVIVALLQAYLLFQTDNHDPKAIFASDSTYRDAGANLAAHRTFSSGTYPDLEPEVLRVPGYSLFIAAIYAISDNSHLSVIFIQNVISVFSILMAYLLARSVFRSRPVGVIAATLSALSLTRLSFVNVDYTETTFTLLLLLFAYFIIRYFQNVNPRSSIFFASLALAAATLTRAGTQYFIILIVLLIGIHLYRNRKTVTDGWQRAGVVTLLLFAMPIVLLQGGWVARNRTVVDLNALSTNGSYVMYFYFGGRIIAERDAISFKDARVQLQQQAVRAGVADLPISEQSSYWTRQGLRIIRDDPVIFAERQAIGMASLMWSGIMSPGPLSNLYPVPDKAEIRTISHEMFLDTNKVKREFLRLNEFMTQGYPGIAIARLFNGVWHLVFFSSAILFMAHLIVRRRALDMSMLVMLMIIVYLWAMPGPIGQVRYRVPIEPFIAAFSGAGVMLAYEWLRASRPWESLARLRRSAG